MGIWLQGLFTAGSSLSACRSVLVSGGGGRRLGGRRLGGRRLGGCRSVLVSRCRRGRGGRGSILVTRCGLGILSRLAGCGLTRRGRGGLLREGRQSEDNGQEQRYDDSVLHFNFLQLGEHCWLHSSTPYGRVAFFLRPLTGKLKASFSALPALR